MPKKLLKKRSKKTIKKKVVFEALSNGWLDPNGKMYPCDWYGHCELADDICGELGVRSQDPSTYLEKKGWLHLTSSLWHVTKPLTQPQIDYVMKWCQSKGKKFPPANITQDYLEP